MENFNASTLKTAAERKAVKAQWDNFIGKTGDLSTVRDVVYVPVRPRILWRKKDAGFSRLNINRFAVGLFNTMKEMSLLSDDVTLEFKKNAGQIGVSLCNALEKENVLFTKGLSQIFDIVCKPRYIIIRKKIFGKLQTYAVPDFLSRNKADAKKFYQNVKGIGMKLVYVQSEAGKKYLLEAGMNILRTGTADVKVVKAVFKTNL